MAGLQFHPDIIKACPPADAVPASGFLYRKVDALPATKNDFISDVERRGGDPSRCDCWGCSIWTTAAAADEALELFPYWKKKYIVRVDLQHSDGVIKKTPTNRQDDHFTFWRDFRVDISPRQKIHYRP